MPNKQPGAIGHAEELAESVAASEELIPAPDPEDVFLRLAGLPHCVFFDSARRDPVLGRYSFIAADPFDYFELPVTDRRIFAVGESADDGLAELHRRLAPFRAETIAGLPPFQGGAAGLLSYDLARQLESLPQPRFDEFGVPALAIGLYDIVVVFDHKLNRAWIISQGFPEHEPQLRRRRAVSRLDEFCYRLLNPPALADEPMPTPQREHRLSLAELAPQHAASGFMADNGSELVSNFSAAEYLEMVRRGIEYIRAGDIFQVNLAQRLLYPAADDPIALYQRLRRRNPATFAGYFDLGEFQILSASPERFLQVVGRQVEARPIKGTRRRTARPEADLFAGDELRQSEKDTAENVMIVDLLRNDLSRVCRPESVVVSELCRLEISEFVQHLVSVVRGELRDGASPLDLVRAAFPGGSITGAPKIRAIQIIAELEPTARGAYCGALGYLGFDGMLDSNLLIRTVTAGRGWWQMPVGGGIVAQSDPECEYAETWHKAEGLLRSLE
jgi:para-aminobenzoate synthetase component 1